MTTRTSPITEDLVAYFTDMEPLCEWFQAAVAAPTLPKRRLVIHGVGGVGKSSLLRMFRLHCKNVRVPVALASGDEAKSAPAILSDWAEDLKADKVKLATFARTLQDYRTLLARAERKGAKFGDAMVKAGAKAAIQTATSAIPILGPVAGALGGVGAEALIDWLRSQGFAKPDIDMLLDPTEKLTADFLANLAKAAHKRRLVVMLDTFEQLTALNDWACDLAQRLNPNVLLVIAGRAMPDWVRAWSGWLAQAHVVELTPMDDDTMRALVRRYYATMRGGDPAPKQVDAIIRFARGLPVVVTSAVQLWVKYGVEDFATVKAEVVADLADRLMEGVPREMVPTLEAAAAVRWFDQPILRAVTGQADVQQVFKELCRFPFVRSRAEGWALHDAVREIMDENLRVQDYDRHRALHERAAAHFEAQMAKRTGEEAERQGLERLYHRVRADEGTGIQLFQEMAEEFVWYHLLNKLLVLLNDVTTYALERENGRLWREYYTARLWHLQARWADAMQMYEALSQNNSAEVKLRAYASCDLGEILSYREILFQSGGVDKALRATELSLRLAPGVDRKLILNYRNQSTVYFSVCEEDRSIRLLDKVREFYKEQNDRYSEASILRSVKTQSALRGNWLAMFSAQKQGLDLLSIQYDKSLLYGELKAEWSPACAWAGRYSEAEENTREGLSIARQLGAIDILGYLRDLGVILAMQKKFGEAAKCFQECEILSLALDRTELERTTNLRWQAVAHLKQGKLSLAKEALSKGLATVEAAKYTRAFGEILTWFGLVDECDGELDAALNHYQRSLDFRSRLYFTCGALTGLVRVKHTQGDYTAVPPPLAEAESLAQQYEYNDHLASLRLTQGHVAWDSLHEDWGTGFDAALAQYQQALVYALRYNRFFLDEVLWGGNCTPLRPIITHCRARGDEGRQMLTALRDWWQAGVNDVGTPRPDTISPIPEGIPLLEAERMAREREPGDGSPQVNVVDKIEEALVAMPVS